MSDLHVFHWEETFPLSASFPLSSGFLLRLHSHHGITWAAGLWPQLPPWLSAVQNPERQWFGDVSALQAPCSFCFFIFSVCALSRHLRWSNTKKTLTDCAHYSQEGTRMWAQMHESWNKVQINNLFNANRKSLQRGKSVERNDSFVSIYFAFRYVNLFSCLLKYIEELKMKQ